METKMKRLSLDEIFDEIGHFGASQVRYICVISVVQIFVAFHMVLNIFTGMAADFECLYSSANSSGSSFTNDTILSLDNACPENDPSRCKIIFKPGFESIVKTFGLVCAAAPSVAAVQSAWMVGVLLGALVLGGLPDRHGRVRCLTVAVAATALCEGLSACATSFGLYVCLRILGGCSCAIVILASFVLSQEVVGARSRCLAGVLGGATFSVGIAILAALAAYSHHWRSLTALVSVAGLPLLLLPQLVPESPGWLASQGRVPEAEEVLRTIAAGNGVAWQPQWQLEAPVVAGKSATISVYDMLRQPTLASMFAVQLFLWFANSGVYYALTLASGELGDSVYIATAFSGLVEVPGGVLVWAVVDRAGRRLTLAGFLVVASVSCAAIPLLPHAAMLPVGLLGKMAISCSFGVCYIHGGELCPTPLRNTLLGLLSAAARVGGVASPLLLTLQPPALPFLLMAGVASAAAVGALLLPETKGQPLPQSIEDLLLLRHGQRQGGYSRLTHHHDED